MNRGSLFLFWLRNSCLCAVIIALLALSLAVVPTAQVSASSLIAGNTLGGCHIFPANNVWNYDISQLPVASRSAQYVASMGLSGHLHPDFGSGLWQGEPIGMPYISVPSSQPGVPVSFTYASESDPGPYPIPTNAPIEGGAQSTGDRHVLVLERGTCKLYELFAGYPQKDGSWKAGSGAVWNLNSNALRPVNWTSADAAGLPILPGLVSYNEILAGVITHAIRVTVNQSQAAFIWPAHHFASNSHDSNLPPMGLRLRLKASVPISSFSRTDQIILTALKQYGMIVADNGASWFISGIPDSRWNNDDLHALTSIPGSDFEAVDESSLELNANSAQVRGFPVSTPTPRPKSTHTPTAAATPVATGSPIAEIRPTPAITPAAGTFLGSGGNGSSALWFVAGASVLFLGILGGGLFFWRRKHPPVQLRETVKRM